MSTSIEFRQFLFEKVGSVMSQSEARALGIDKELFHDSDLNHNEEIDVQEEILDEVDGELYMQLYEMFEDEQAAAAEEEEEIAPAEGASGGTGA